MKKSVFYLLIIFTVVIICSAVHYISLPNVTLTFDYKGSAYQLNTKKPVKKKIQLDGYSNISHVTSNKDGYFCYGQKANVGYFLEVKNNTVVSTVKVPNHLYNVVFSTATQKNRLIVNCTYGVTESGTDLPKQVLLQVDFEGRKTIELPVPDQFWVSDLNTNGDVILLGAYSDRKESYDIYLYENQQLSHLTEGYHPVFVNESKFLYFNSGETKQYDLTSKKNQISEYKIDLKKHMAFDSFSSPKIAEKWSVAFNPGINVLDGENLISRIGFCNIETGKKIPLWSTVGMHVENVEILEVAN